MNKQLYIRRGFLVAAGMVGCLSIGVYIERFGITHGMFNADGYQFFDTLVDVRTQILKNYVEPVDDKKLLAGAIQGMMGQLDPYSNYFDKDEYASFDRSTHGQFSGIGAEMSQDKETGAFIVVSPLEDSPALKAGMLAGDRILKINGVTVQGFSLKDLITKVSGEQGTNITITVLHEGEKTPVDLTVTRGVVTVQSVKGYQHNPAGNGSWDYLIDPEHHIAYVRINSFMEGTAEEMDKALLPLIKSDAGLKGIILDLRFDPGGLLTEAIAVSNRFLDSGVIVSTRGRDGRDEFVATANKEKTYPHIPLVVLVNEYSASASEIVSGALKDHGRGVLIGTRTFGKGSVQNLITLEGGQSAIKLTTAYYYLPSGRNIMRKKGATTWGVDPDLLVPLTDEENKEVVRARMSSEIIRPRRATTMPVAGGSSTQASTETANVEGAAGTSATQDRQLQRALEVLAAFPTLSGEIKADVTTTRPNVTASALPTPDGTTQPAPASAPATAPAPATPAAPESRARPLTLPADPF